MGTTTQALLLLGLGLSVGASFGPVNVELTKQCVQHGYRNGVPFAIGALLGDGMLATIGLAIGHSGRTQLNAASFPMGITAGILLVWIGARSLRRLWTNRDHNLKSDRGLAAGTSLSQFATAFGITVLSPFGIILWLSAAIYVTNALAPWPLSVNVAIIMAGDFAWFVCCVVVPTWLGQLMSEQMLRRVAVVANLVLTYFGLSLIYTTIMLF